MEFNGEKSPFFHQYFTWIFLKFEYIYYFEKFIAHTIILIYVAFYYAYIGTLFTFNVKFNLKGGRP